MSPRPTYSFGEPNWDTVGRWLHLDPADDGHVLMLNLMKYHPVARYGDGRETTATGRDADDAYAPLESLSAIGATVAYFADVEEQTGGQPAWDRVAIVDYPTRASFFEMQQRQDFQAKYVHKEAGMAFSIIMGCLPSESAPEAGGHATDRTVLRVLRRTGADTAPELPGTTAAVLTLGVDGVVLGDERSYHEVRFERLPAGRPLADAVATGGVEEEFVMVVAPTIDRLTGGGTGD